METWLTPPAPRSGSCQTKPQLSSPAAGGSCRPHASSGIRWATCWGVIMLSSPNLGVAVKSRLTLAELGAAVERGRERQVRSVARATLEYDGDAPGAPQALMVEQPRDDAGSRQIGCTGAACCDQATAAESTARRGPSRFSSRRHPRSANRRATAVRLRRGPKAGKAVPGRPMGRHCGPSSRDARPRSFCRSALRIGFRVGQSI